MRIVLAVLGGWTFWVAAIIELGGWPHMPAAHAAMYTQAEADACTPDAKRFCPEEIKSSLPTLNTYYCMMAHRAQLSKPCDAVFKSHRQ